MREAPTALGAAKRAALSVLFLLLFPILLGAGREPAAPADPEVSLRRAAAPPPGTVLLILPSMRQAGEREINPWTRPSEKDRFKRFEGELTARFAEFGYGVISSRQALGQDAARTILREATQPLTPRWAAEAAGAVGAAIVLVVRADAIRSSAASSGASHTTDALVEALAYRAADGVRLARASTRVTGSGASEAEADGETLAHAARPLSQLLAGPLAVALSRPLLPPRPLPIILEGRLRWAQYRKLVDVIREEIPEIQAIEERRFAHQRLDLMAVCACEAPDAARRLDGRRGAGFKLEAEVEGDGVRLRAAPLSFP